MSIYNEVDPKIQIALVGLVVGFALLFVDSRGIAEELHNRNDVVSVGCKFVNSSVSEARCPRKQYVGCGCPIDFSEGCRTLSPDTDFDHCCEGSCVTQVYYGGTWNMYVDEKQYAVSYVPCEKVSAVFTIAGKDYTYVYFCDEGHLFEAAKEARKSEGNCSSLYENRRSCFVDGQMILMQDPYEESSLVGFVIGTAAGSLLCLCSLWLCYLDSNCRRCIKGRGDRVRAVAQVEPQPETVQLTDVKGTVEMH